MNQSNSLTDARGNLVPTYPQSAEAEEAILGSMLIGGPEVLEEARAVITSTWFFNVINQILFEAMLSLHSAGVPIDLVTFTQQLRDADQLERVGGGVYVTHLFLAVPSAALFHHYVQILREKWVLRQMIEGANEIIRRSLQDQGNFHENVDYAQQFFTTVALSLSNRAQNMRPISEVVDEVITSIEATYHKRGSVKGLATGFTEFDRMTGGLTGGQYVTIAGRPSMGKSAMAMNIAEHVAMEVGRPVAVFSLEMSMFDITQRLLLRRGRVNLRSVRSGMLKDADLPKIRSVGEEFKAAPIIYVDDTPGLRLFEFTARARRVKMRHNVALIVIDYLQLMSSGTKRGADNRVMEITELTAGIKKIARELDIPILCLAQVNRDAEKRPNAKPRLADLRESGSIEQDSDIVAFIWRAEVYAHSEEQKQELQGQADLIVAKHRNGPDGDVALTFIKEYASFQDRATESGEHVPLYSNNPERRNK